MQSISNCAGAIFNARERLGLEDRDAKRSKRSDESPGACCSGADDLYADFEFGFVNLVLSGAD